MMFGPLDPLCLLYFKTISYDLEEWSKGIPFVVSHPLQQLFPLCLLEMDFDELQLVSAAFVSDWMPWL